MGGGAFDVRRMIFDASLKTPAGERLLIGPTQAAGLAGGHDYSMDLLIMRCEVMLFILNPGSIQVHILQKLRSCAGTEDTLTEIFNCRACISAFACID